MSASSKLLTWPITRSVRRSRVLTPTTPQRCYSTIDLTQPTSKIQTPKQKSGPKIPSSALSYHWETLPPTNAQLQYADKFFSKRQPVFLWSAPKFATMSFGQAPEVCFLGRSNVGKSSLLNALLGKNIAYTSSKPGRTRLMNAFGVGQENAEKKYPLVVLDMPGYGKGSQTEWGTQIMRYLEQRKELKRAFLLIDTVHGIKSSDEQLLDLFRDRGIPHQIVLSKVDRLFFPKTRDPSEAAIEFRSSELKRLMENCRVVIQPLEDTEGHAALGEIIACSAEKQLGGKKLGIDSVRHAILQAVGLELSPPQKVAAAVKVVPHEKIWGNLASNDQQQS